MTQSHADHLDSTIAALNMDLSTLGEAGPKAVKGWIDSINATGVEALKPVAGLLQDLHDQITSTNPDGTKIAKLLADMGEHTTAAAKGVEGEVGTKLAELGKTLSAAGKMG